jgi:hypothetical protein
MRSEFIMGGARSWLPMPETNKIPTISGNEDQIQIDQRP